MNKHHCQVLQKGLKFTPTPEKCNPHELESDIQEFIRKIRLAEFFDGEDDTDPSLVRNKSDFIPPKQRNLALEKFASNINNYPRTQRDIKIKSNITNDERKAMRELANDKSIVIKEADKGGAVVIMDSEKYKQLVNGMLNDTNYYEKLHGDPSKSDKIRYQKLIEEFKDQFTRKELDYLKRFEVKSRNLYGLPKIHKSEVINKACEKSKSHTVIVSDVTDLKLRPIVAGPSCQTHRLSNLLDILLRPLTQFVPSYLRDSIDFLNSLPAEVPSECILVSYDVESLYSNISHDLGIEAIKFWLEKYRTAIPNRFSNEFIIKSTAFILENNTFYFNGEHFKQIKGTAMGTKFAPVYATLVLGYLEQKLYQQITTEFGTSYGTYFRNNWKRFLDDIFIIWIRSFEDLNTVSRMLNNLHPDLNFVPNYDENQLPFLDVLVKKVNCKIETDIFYKPTDSKQYLIFNSCHPKHTKENIPFGLARRLCTIVSDEQILTKRIDELKTYLKAQNYPLSLIETGTKAALRLNKKSLRKVKDKPKGNRIPFVNTHNPRNLDFFGKIRENLPILEDDKKMSEILKKYKIIKSKRQPDNLKKILTRARFDENVIESSVSKCGRSNCGLCEYLLEGNCFNFRNGKTFRVCTSMSCETQNVIYVIRCCGCAKEYIGETGDSLRKRMTLHRQHIKDKSVRVLFVSEHISTCATSLKPQFKVFPLLKIHSDNLLLRREKERYFINIFKPELNSR